MASIFIRPEFSGVNCMSSAYPGHTPYYYSRAGYRPFMKRTRAQLAYPDKYAAAQKRRRMSQARQIVAAPQAPLPAAWQPTATEIKAIDGAFTNYQFRVPTATNCILCNGVQTGAAFYNRVGSRIEMKNLHLRGYIYNVATSLTTNLRLLVVYDRQPTGGLPTISDLLLSRDQTGATVSTGDSEINLDNRDRFLILRDKQYYAPPCTNTAAVLTNGPSFPAVDQEWDLNEFIKLKGLGTHYKSSSSPTTIADISTGALYCFFVASQSDQCWSVNMQFRLRFVDK